MKKKNGWGFLEFFFFLGLFIVCLLVTAYALRKVGLLNEDWKFVDFYDKGKDSNESDIYKYSDIETKLIDSTKKYIKDFYNNNLGVDTLNIKISSLISNNYISEVRDKDGNCTGYVSVYKDDNNVVIYTTYLKCKNYVSNGYVERHDG